MLFELLPKRGSFQFESNQTTTTKKREEKNQDLAKQYGNIQTLPIKHSKYPVYNPQILKM